MGRTDRHLNLKVDGSQVLEECREIDLDSKYLTTTVDTNEETASLTFNKTGLYQDIIPLIIGLG